MIQKLIDSKSQQKILSLLTIVGGIVVVKKIISLSIDIIKIIIPQESLNQKYFYKDSYVMVTGATDGVGKGFCIKFAQQGFNIIMISRNLQKSQKLGKELEEKYKIKYKIILVDFNDCTENDFYDSILDQIKNLDIAVLVNNIGLYMQWKQIYHKTDLEIKQFINVNVLSQVILSKNLVDKMKSRPKRSAIINLSSFAAQYPMGIYSATKVFNDFFSRSLSVENRDKIDVISMRPRMISTPMNNFSKGAMIISVEQLVDSTINRLGRFDESNGHFNHILQSFWYNLFPDSWVLKYRWNISQVQKKEQKPPQLIEKKKTLHWVFKIPERKQTLYFYKDILGMQILRHEEFSEGCKASCNGKYDGMWSKTMVGYGCESNHFAIELTYNYNIKNYKNGNDFRYIEIYLPGIIDKLKTLKYPIECELIENGVQSIFVKAPGDYKFKLVDAQKEGNDPIHKLSLNSSNLYYQQQFWIKKLGMKQILKDPYFLQFKANDSDQTLIEFAQIQVQQIDHSEAFGRIAFSCEDPKPAEQIVNESGIGNILTPLVKLDTPGKATVEVVILQDTDNYEICFVGEKGFRELSQIDMQAQDLLTSSISEKQQ